MRTDAEFFHGHLRALGIRPGDRLCVHSRLLSFGRVRGGPGTILDALRDAVTETGTLCFPTFTLNLTADDIFNPAATPPHLMGALSQHVFEKDGFTRSPCPMHSYAALGKDAALIRRAAEDISVGAGSVFEVMQQEGFKLLLLGCNFHEGATHVHQSEAAVGVPYREWLTLPRQVTTAEGTVRRIAVRYYARRSDLNLRTSLHAYEKAVAADLPDAFLPIGDSTRTSFVMALDDFDRLTRKALEADPYILMEPIPAADGVEPA